MLLFCLFTVSNHRDPCIDTADCVDDLVCVFQYSACAKGVCLCPAGYSYDGNQRKCSPRETVKRKAHCALLFIMIKYNIKKNINELDFLRLTGSRPIRFCFVVRNDVKLNLFLLFIFINGCLNRHFRAST